VNDAAEKQQDPHHSEPTRSSRDRDELGRRLEQWLGRRLDTSRVAVGNLRSPDGSGMSSETLLFDVSWTADGTENTAALVARIEPSGDDAPVFETYDLAQQHAVIELVGRASDVPVPPLRWLETDPAVLGAAFFVMERVNGRVPADIPPYVMEGWLLEATPAEQRKLQDGSVGVLARLHQIDTESHDLGFLAFDVPGDTALRRHFEHQRRYYHWAREDRHHGVIERAFAWLEANWPAETGPDVLCWGDARIGNVMYDGFEPLAILDWEMAAVAPGELDIGWMIFLHRFFQDIAGMLELPGLPDFMLADDVVSTYESLGGRTVNNLAWFEAYAALRHAVVMTRVTTRSVHFGEAEWPEDIDSVIPHRAVLAAMTEQGV
jgi:aminoglycoside phosphotransferase (APT) family kinase protein